MIYTKLRQRASEGVACVNFDDGSEKHWCPDIGLGGVFLSNKFGLLIKVY